MTLSIVGAGLGRTGTLSLKAALEQLGIGRCYHMSEVAANPGHAACWQQALDDGAADWDVLLDGYAATVDWPACHFWRALARHAPEARVLLSVRDPERWFESISATIFDVLRDPIPAPTPEPIRRQLEMSRALMRETFGEPERWGDREHVISLYERHNEAVQREIPAARLLVHRVAEGWEPLCRFLGVEAPQDPFPKVNSTDEFRSRVAAMREAVRGGADRSSS